MDEVDLTWRRSGSVRAGAAASDTRSSSGRAGNANPSAGGAGAGRRGLIVLPLGKVSGERGTMKQNRGEAYPRSDRSRSPEMRAASPSARCMTLRLVVSAKGNAVCRSVERVSEEARERVVGARAIAACEMRVKTGGASLAGGARVSRWTRAKQASSRRQRAASVRARAGREARPVHRHATTPDQG